MVQRIISTVSLWVIVGFLFYFFGAPAAAILLAILSLATQYEFYRLLEKMGQRPFKALGCTLGTFMILAPFFASRWAGGHIEGIQSGLIAVTIVACCLRILVERESEERVEALGATLFGLIYIPFMLNYLVRTLELPGDDVQGLMLIVWIIVAAKFCDVGALLIGKAFGRHPMSPRTSPKKTWEGAVGGCAISVLLGFALTALLRDLFPPFFTPLWGALFALPIAIISIISDLVESMIKRMALEKDSGRFIPGIGGAFDLMDSLILAAPTGFFLFGLVN